MKIRNKLTNRVYRGDKVVLFTEDGMFTGYLPKALIESLIISLEDYDELR